MTNTSIDEILDSLVTLNNEQKSKSNNDHWKEAANLSREEKRAFEIDTKKLAVSEELIHRSFTL